MAASSATAADSSGPRLVNCDSLSKSYDGKRYQFRDVSLGVATGSRIGLVGVNGVGKSTLMKCIAGLEDLDGGSVSFEGRPTVLYVEQEPARGQDSAGGADWSVADALTEPMVAGASAATPAAAKTGASLKAVRAYWAATAAQEELEKEGTEEAAGSGDSKAATAAAAAAAEEKMAEAVDLMGGADAWELEQELGELASRLSVGDAAFRRRPVSSLSGGQRKRVALAAALAQSADVLLLDEPTNHLDWEAIDWLQAHLSHPRRRDLSLVLVTHDRSFLERTCDTVLELEAAAVHAYRTDGSYDTFVRRRAARRAAEEADLGRQQEVLKREAAWDAKSPRARQAKSKSRSAAYQDLKAANEQRLGDRAASAATAGGGADLGAAAAAAAKAAGAGGASGGGVVGGGRAGFGKKKRGGGRSGAERWLGEKVVSFEGARLSLTATIRGGNAGEEEEEEETEELVLLDGLSCAFNKGDRVGVVGRNGAGKTSFLRCLVGEMDLTDGRRAVGDTVRFGYYDQRGLRTEKGQEKAKLLDYVVSQVELGVDSSGGGASANADFDFEDFEGLPSSPPAPASSAKPPSKAVGLDVARQLLTKYGYAYLYPTPEIDLP